MNAESRPLVRLAPAPALWFLDAIAAGAVIASVVDLVSIWPELPDVVPSHVSLAGEIDGYAGKWALAVLPAVAAAMVVTFTLLARAPHRLNYPTEVTAENAERLYRLTRAALGALKAEIAVGLALMSHEFVRLANGTPPAALLWIAGAMIAAVLATIVWAVVRMTSAAR